MPEALEYDAYIFQDGTVKTVVTSSGSNCSDVLKVVQRLGVITDSERTGEDCPTVHETTSC